MEVRFDFGVYDITLEQAGKLFDAFTALVEELDAHIGGGYGEYEAEAAAPEPSGSDQACAETWRPCCRRQATY